MLPSFASPPLVGGRTDKREEETRLSGSWLLLARLVCVVLYVSSVVLFIAGVFAYTANDYCTGPATTCHTYGPVVVRSIQGLGIYTIVRNSLFSLGYWLVAAFIFWRKSNDRVALLAAVYLGLFPIVFNNGFMSTLTSYWWFPVHVTSFLGNLCAVLFFYVFPTGRFVPSWIRWVFLVAIVPYTFLNAFFPFSALNPFYTSATLNNVFFIGQIGSFVAVQLYRYRRVSTLTLGQQSMWVVYGIVVGWGGYLLLLAIRLLFPSFYQANLLINLITGTALYGFILLMPFFIGVAIVRARLWDIDVLINRTLVYGCLTLCVVGVYVLVVGYLGTLVGASGNLLVELLATGLVAVLFQPLRAWLQQRVNRLLYGQRDEPYAVVTRLSQRLEAQLSPNTVLSTIVDTVAQALKLPYVAILLKQENTFRLAASAGSLVGEPLSLPLVYQQDIVGHMQLAPRAPGESFTSADIRLLEELARQAGLAAHAVQLTADLHRSYEQLEQRVAERTAELSSLLDISHTVASTLQLKPLLRLILDQLKLVIDYTSCSILTADDGNLVFLDHRGPVSEEQLTRLRVPLEQLGPMWESIAAGATVLVDNVHEETRHAQALRAAMGDMLATTFQYVCSLMAVPLVLGDQVIGTLVLASSEERAFTEHSAALALAIANQASIAIENARLYEQAQELAALEERQKLARELHDSVSQALYGIALGLHTARIQLDRDPQRLPASLDDTLLLAEGALAEMRALIFELRPESLEREGLVAALSRQGAALQARHDITVRLDLCEEPGLPLKAKQELYRIAQEALHNTVKHAHASNVDLVLREADGAVVLEVRDDGVGFDPTGAFPGHLGLHSMRERVSHLHGWLKIESAPGRGTHLLAHIPAEHQRDAAMNG